MEHVIDAKGRPLGRVASEAATVLLGKDTTVVKKNVVRNITVRITNAKDIQISEKKKLQKTYHSHTGYPGSGKETPMKDIIAAKGHKEVIVRAVKGMLPLNTLREKRLKHLLIEE